MGLRCDFTGRSSRLGHLRVALGFCGNLWKSVDSWSVDLVGVTLTMCDDV